jgi:hypothetical protein
MIRFIILAAAILWPAIVVAQSAPSTSPYGTIPPSPPSKPSPPLVCSTYDSLLQIMEGSSMTGPMTVGHTSGGITIEVLPGLELKGPIKIEACDGRVIISKD